MAIYGYEPSRTVLVRSASCRDHDNVFVIALRVLSALVRKHEW